MGDAQIHFIDNLAELPIYIEKISAKIQHKVFRIVNEQLKRGEINTR